MDFSDLGGKRIEKNNKIDFSDLGGKRIDTPPSSIASKIGDASSTAYKIMSGEGSDTLSKQEKYAQSIVSGTPLMRALDIVSGAGRYIEPKIQKAAGWVAEKTGQLGEKVEQKGYPVAGGAIKSAGIVGAGVAGTLAQASIPKDRISSIMTLAGLSPSEAAEVQAVYKVPTKAQRVIAEIAGTQSGVKPQHLAAVIANPEIMSDATPSMAAVGKEYQKVFKELGMKFDSRQYQEITGMRYAPNDTQTSKFLKILGNSANKLESAPETMTPADAFLARSAGKKALDGPLSPRAKSQISADVSAMDTYLENNGIPQIKELGQKYFRAAAKESLENIVPRNKQGNPAVVRSLIMAHYGKEALAALSEGKPIKAAISAGSGAIMSPLVQGKAIPFFTGRTSPMALGAGVTIPTSIRALQSQRDRDGK